MLMIFVLKAGVLLVCRNYIYVMKMVGYIILLSMLPKQCVFIENNQSNLVIAYNNSLWDLLNIPKHSSASEMFVSQHPLIW